MHEQARPGRRPRPRRRPLGCGLRSGAPGAIGEALSILGLLAIPADADLLDDADRALLTDALVDCRLARGELAEAMALGDGSGRRTSSSPGCPAPSPTTPAASWPRRSATRSSPLDHYSRRRATAGDPAPPSCCRGAPAPRSPCCGAGAAREAAALAREHHLERGARLGLAVRRWRSRCAPWPRPSPATAGALLREARAVLDGVRADRLAAQIDTDLAGLLLLTPRRRHRRGPGAAARRRGVRRPPGAVAAAGPGTPAARPAGRGSRSQSRARRWPR